MNCTFDDHINLRSQDGSARPPDGRVFWVDAPINGAALSRHPPLALLPGQAFKSPPRDRIAVMLVIERPFKA